MVINFLLSLLVPILDQIPFTHASPPLKKVALQSSRGHIEDYRRNGALWATTACFMENCSYTFLSQLGIRNSTIDRFVTNIRLPRSALFYFCSQIFY